MAEPTPEQVVIEVPRQAEATGSVETTSTDIKKEKSIASFTSQSSETTAHPPKPLPWIPVQLADWLMTLIIGCFTVSHWRGLWTLFDLWTCDQPQDATGPNGYNFCFEALYALDSDLGQIRFDSGIFTYWLGIIFTIVGVAMVWLELWTPSASRKVTPARGLLRFCIVLILGFAAVCQWRGIWYVTDETIWKDQPLNSYWLTTCVGMGGAFLLCCGASLLAPPFIFLIDGPGLVHPPVAVTIVSSYYSLILPASETPPEHNQHTNNVILLLVDVLTSFFGLPILVVWYWRGCWYLQDYYFGGFSSETQDLNVSLAYSTILAFVCAVVASEPLMYFFPDKEHLKQRFRILTPIVGRLRTLILAIGNTAFWRVVWNLWDLGGTSYASAWTSEVVSVFALTAIGCVTCITAPPATLGVDVTPHPQCHDEPLFSMLPVPWEILYVFGIGRQPTGVTVPAGVEPVDSIEPNVEEEKVATPEIPPPRPFLEMARSWHLENHSYFERQRPGLGDMACPEGVLSQRPCLENARHRSQYFRSR